MAEDISPLKGNYKQFVQSPGGIYFLRFLDEKEKALVFQAQNADDPLLAMKFIKQSQIVGEIRAHVDSLSH